MMSNGTSIVMAKDNWNSDSALFHVHQIDLISLEAAEYSLIYPIALLSQATNGGIEYSIVIREYQIRSNASEGAILTNVASWVFV